MKAGLAIGLVIPDLWQQEAVRALQQGKDVVVQAPTGSGKTYIFELIDADIISDGKRKVFKFSLKPVEKKSFGRVVELPHNRLIPTPVKVEVWRRDGGKCVQCASTKNLHFDHDIPFSKGGSSLTAANVRLLCAKHNLEKSDKILSIAPWLFVSAAAAVHVHHS